MSLRNVLAISLRIMTQLRRDLRTLALVLVAPVVIMTLVKYLLEGHPEAFQRVGGPALGLFPFIQMFLITSIALLRERTAGTLERLLTMPLAKIDLLAGYALAFAFLAAAQAALVVAVAFIFLGLDLAGSPWPIFGLSIANAILGVSLGLLASGFANNEFEASEFMPTFILPQVLLCGLLVPRDQMAGWLRVVADVMPLTYAYDALDRVSKGEHMAEKLVIDLAVVGFVTLAALALGAATLKRRTA